MSTIQDVIHKRDIEAEVAIDICAMSIADAAEYRPTIERRDSALYRLLRAVYFAGRNAGIEAQATATENREGRG